MAGDEAIKKERGKRIKQLRIPTGLTRRAFARKHDVPYGTLQYWEDGNFGGLSEDGAHKLCQAFAKEGIKCTPEWLLYGSGEMPVNIHEQGSKSTNLNIQESQSTYVNPITEELKLFYRHNPTAIHSIVYDNTMQPRFYLGDYVAGIQKFDNEIDTLIDKPCIIKTKLGKTLIRILQKDKESNQFILSAENKATDKEKIDIDEILSAAAIIWIRREEE